MRVHATLVEPSVVRKILDLAVAPRSGARPRRLLTDVAMPGMSGPELALRVVSTRPRVKILHMSGFMDQAAPEDEESVFLQKPFSPETLARRVRHALDEPE
jgi:FixJ family two-component response regulator